MLLWFRNLYLSANAELSDSPPESDNSVSFLFDPVHPVPTIGGALAALMELVPLDGLLDPFWGKFMSIGIECAVSSWRGRLIRRKNPELWVQGRPIYRLLRGRYDIALLTYEKFTAIVLAHSTVLSVCHPTF
jgi:hypothetical protein